jgi:hypothetical protein
MQRGHAEAKRFLVHRTAELAERLCDELECAREGQRAVGRARPARRDFAGRRLAARLCLTVAAPTATAPAPSSPAILPAFAGLAAFARLAVPAPGRRRQRRRGGNRSR